MNELVTVVLVNKNRDRVRVERCVKSLLEQTVPCNVVIVDYGSDDKSWYPEVLNNTNVTWIEVTRDTEVFNKCRALNIGFKSTNTKYFLASDIDIIFSPNFIQEVVKVFEKKPKSIILCQKVDLTQNGTEVDLHEPSASGSCIAIESGWMNKVHGFDEYYTYWGREDNDLVDRAIRDGYEVIWITEKTKIWHQWHEPATQKTLQENDWYYRKSDKSIIRNPNGWGEI